MKHHKPEQLIEKAAPVPSAEVTVRMTRKQRLERWAAVLESHKGSLNALRQIEYLSPADRRAYRGDNTPLSAAFNDPVLRNEGLSSDRLGDAMDFFELTNEDAHRLMCDCHYHGTMTGTGLAARVRYHASRQQKASMWDRAQAIFSGH